MKRAMEAHKTTLLLLYQYYIEAFRAENPSLFLGPDGTFFGKTRNSNEAFRTKNLERVREIHNDLNRFLDTNEISEHFKLFETRRQSNIQFRSILTYMKMVERLFLFRYAVRSRNWMLHLKSTEDLIGDVISLDRIKYRRMLPVYLAEMKGLQES